MYFDMSFLDAVHVGAVFIIVGLTVYVVGAIVWVIFF